MPSALAIVDRRSFISALFHIGFQRAKQPATSIVLDVPGKITKMTKTDKARQEEKSESEDIRPQEKK
jgi:hypothetical protein